MVWEFILKVLQGFNTATRIELIFWVDLVKRPTPLPVANSYNT